MLPDNLKTTISSEKISEIIDQISTPDENGKTQGLDGLKFVVHQHNASKLEDEPEITVSEYLAQRISEIINSYASAEFDAFKNYMIEIGFDPANINKKTSEIYAEAKKNAPWLK